MKAYRLVFILFLLIVAALGGGVFAYLVIQFGHDEHMYVTAGYLVKEGRMLYRDFAYLQAPYLPLIYGFVYKLTGTSHYLLAAKGICFSFWAATVLLCSLIARKLIRDSLIVAGLILVFMLNGIVLISAREVSNYVEANAFSLLALLCFLRGFSGPGLRPFMFFLSGLAIAMATGIKMYYAALFAPFAIAGLFYPAPVAWRGRILQAGIPWLAGAGIGLLPLLGYALSFPDAFVFNNAQFHLLNTQARELAGRVFSKAEFTRELFSRTDNLALAVGTVCLLLVAATGKPSPFFRKEVLLLLAVIAVSLVTIFIPTPIWPSYFSMPVIFLPLWLASLSAGLAAWRRNAARVIVLGIVLVSAWVNIPKLASSVRDSTDLDNWSGIGMHKTALEIADIVRNLPGQPRIATLSPVYAIEANLPIYPELATGPFAYRVAELVPPDKLAKLNIISPERLPTLLSRNPPAGILVGYEGGLDDAFIDFARENNYRQYPRKFERLTLFVRRN